MALDIVIASNTSTVRALKRLFADTPIIFASSVDPVGTRPIVACVLLLFQFFVEQLLKATALHLIGVLTKKAVRDVDTHY